MLVREDHLQCAYVERSAGGASLKWLRRMPFEGGTANTLRKLRRSLPGQRYRCSTMIPRGSYQTFEVPAPKVERVEWCDALRWVIKDDLEFPVEQALIEAMAIPNEGAPHGRVPMTFVIAARREVVTEVVQSFQRGRMPLRVISVANMAQRNVAAMFEAPGRGLAFIGIYQRGVSMTFTRDAAIYASRSVAWDLPFLRDDAEPEARHHHLERVVLDVQRSLDSFDREFGHVSVQRVLVCVQPGHTELVAALRQGIRQTVDVADLRQVMDVSACPELNDPAVQTQWMLAIGMGLRVEDDA